MRVSLAAYRFQRNDKQSRDNAVKDSLRSVAAQIAKQNFVYSKYLSTYLETKDLSFLRDMSVEDLPKELLPHSNIRETKESTYVLLFDGLDQLSADDAKQLFAASFAMRSSYVRIIITGTEDIFRSCLKYVNRGLESVSSIDVAANNGSDIKRFVQSELRTRLCKEMLAKY